MAPIPSAVIKAVSDARTLNEREVATRLLEMLGPTLTTAIGDAKDTRAARQWAAGRRLSRERASCCSPGDRSDRRQLRSRRCPVVVCKHEPRLGLEIPTGFHPSSRAARTA
jgi:hypothetical protein